MLFVHTWFRMQFAFNFFWHDLDLLHQSYIKKSVASEFHYEYISLLIDNSLGIVHSRMNFKEALSHLAAHSKYHWLKCIHAHNQHTLQMITGPCGKITVQHDHLVPLHHDWTIQVWAGTLLNMTILEVNILSDTISCKTNFFSLSEADDSETREITRLCGQTGAKIYYSTQNVVKVTLAVVLLQSHSSRQIDFQYKVITNNTLHDLKFLPAQFIKERQGFEYNLHTLHFISYKNISIFFYNTYVYLRFVVEQSNKTSDCSALIYDGPSSRSPLLTGKGNSQSNLQHISTLSCISVYFRHVATLLDPQCITIYLKRESVRPGHMNIGSNKTIRLSLGSDKHNTYLKLVFSAQNNTFVNIQFESFQFIGNTEAGCYFGGVLFTVAHPGKEYKHGPLCGQYVLSLLRDKGLTFSSHTVYVVIFLYANSGHMSFVMKVTSSQCEGIINPCELKTGTHKHMHHTVIRKQGDTNYIHIKMNDISQYKCLHVQHFFNNNIHSKLCIIQMSNTNQEAGLHVKAELFHNDAPSLTCGTCSNILGTRIFQVKIDTFVSSHISWDSLDGYDLSFPNSSQPYSHSSKQFIFESYMISTYASLIDGSFLLSVKTHKASCAINHIHMDHLEPFNEYGMQIEPCSITTVNTRGGSVHSFSFDLNPGFQLFLQIELGNTKSCPSYTHNEVILWQFYGMQGYPINQRFVFRKQMEWTIENWFSEKTGIIVNVLLQTSNSKIDEAVHRNDDGFLAHRCQDEISLRLSHKEDVLQGTKVFETRQKGSDHYCGHSGCYYMYNKTSTSWEGASGMCTLRGKHLLSIGSDFEAKIITHMMRSHPYLLFSPVIFLNLKRNSKVRAYFCSLISHIHYASLLVVFVPTAA